RRPAAAGRVRRPPFRILRHPTALPRPLPPRPRRPPAHAAVREPADALVPRPRTAARRTVERPRAGATGTRLVQPPAAGPRPPPGRPRPGDAWGRPVAGGACLLGRTVRRAHSTALGLRGASGD